jgi:hypothetical protein
VRKRGRLQAFFVLLTLRRYWPKIKQRKRGDQKNEEKIRKKEGHWAADRKIKERIGRRVRHRREGELKNFGEGDWHWGLESMETWQKWDQEKKKRGR